VLLAIITEKKFYATTQCKKYFSEMQTLSKREKIGAFRLLDGVSGY